MGNCCGKQKDERFLIISNQCFYCSYENKNRVKLNKHMDNCKHNYTKVNLTTPFISKN